MNFTQAVNEVVGIIKRPDLIASARREINSAIMFYCLDNHFARDFVEQSITLDAQQYTQSFSLNDLTRFRDFEYLKIGGTKAFLSKVSETERKAGCFTSNKYYIAGTNVNVSLRSLSASLDVGYYSYPPLLTNEDTHWMLDIQPYMIIDRACSVLFKTIGDERSMNAHRSSAGELYMAARKDLIRN